MGHHTASVLIMPEDRMDRALVSIYDQKYSTEIFRGHFITFGGSAEGDCSPLATVKREVAEEIGNKPVTEAVGNIWKSIAADNPPESDYFAGRKYADKMIIDALRAEVLRKIAGFGDYVIFVPKKQIYEPQYWEEKPDVHFISSVYVSPIDAALFECVEQELLLGNEIIAEGYSAVICADALLRGEPRGAWGCSTTTGEILGLRLPEYDFVQVEALGAKPREFFADYKKDFTYTRRGPEAARLSI